MDNLVEYGSVSYIQVHPTFLYESMWNLALFAILLLYRKHKKFDGELLMIYFIWYGIGRAFLETLRTDSLLVGGIPSSIIVSIILAILGAGTIVYKRTRKVG